MWWWWWWHHYHNHNTQQHQHMRHHSLFTDSHNFHHHHHRHWCDQKSVITHPSCLHGPLPIFQQCHRWLKPHIICDDDAKGNDDDDQIMILRRRIIIITITIQMVMMTRGGEMKRHNGQIGEISSAPHGFTLAQWCTTSAVIYCSYLLVQCNANMMEYTVVHCNALQCTTIQSVVIYCIFMGKISSQFYSFKHSNTPPLL